jgi:hypothetical protein
MADLTSSWIAVAGTIAGTLVGAGGGYLSQRANARRTERAAQSEHLRQERMTIYSAFAGAVMEYRRAQLDRWKNRGQPEDRDRANEVYRTRSKAWHEYYRVRMITSTKEIDGQAYDALRLATRLKDAASDDDLNKLGEDCRRSVLRFSDIAAREVNPDVASSPPDMT